MLVTRLLTPEYLIKGILEIILVDLIRDILLLLLEPLVKTMIDSFWVYMIVSSNEPTTSQDTRGCSQVRIFLEQLCGNDWHVTYTRLFSGNFVGQRNTGSFAAFYLRDFTRFQGLNNYLRDFVGSFSGYPLVQITKRNTTRSFNNTFAASYEHGGVRKPIIEGVDQRRYLLQWFSPAGSKSYLHNRLLQLITPGNGEPGKHSYTRLSRS